VLRAIGFISDHRIAEVLEVDSDLVRPAGVQCSLDQGSSAEPFFYAVTRSRFSALPSACSHPLAVRWMPFYAGLDFSGFPGQFSAEHCEIEFLHGSLGELLA
jgi:hypothetical protein